MFKKIFKKKTSFIAASFLILIAILAIFADFFAPYRYDQEDIAYLWAPPAKLQLASFKNKIYRPVFFPWKSERNMYYKRIYLPDKNKPLAIRFFVKGFEYKLLGFIPANIHLFGSSGPEKIYILGADGRGRDIFSRLVYGARISLSVGVIGVIISFSLGMFIGAVSGYFGGKVDFWLMRLVEMMMMIPGFYLMLALRASFPPAMSSVQVYLLIIVILSFIGWASIARVIRGMSLSLREREFITALEVEGLSRFKIITRHIIPHTFSYGIVTAFLSIPGYIIGEAALSMLGLGIQEPEASWGNMLALAQGIVTIQIAPWILTPGLLIVLVTICFNVIGDSLREILTLPYKNYE